jgi:o-succinylbenzoate synthase
MIHCNYQKYILKFCKPGGTSRGVLAEKETWFLFLYDDENPGKKAWGECGLFKGLSADDRPEYEEKLKEVCAKLPEQMHGILPSLKEWPSIHFGDESDLKDWEKNCNQILFKSDFTEKNQGIPINGLIWMGSMEEMLAQIKSKLEEGYQTLKLKIGALDFETELAILKTIRKEYTSREITIRVDANGAFSPEEAVGKLHRLSVFDIHSIEQPIKAGQWQEMAALSEKSPVPIALDEELIGVHSFEQKKQLINTISPPYIILKPTLAGGFAGSDEWIKLIEEQGGNWWITSALESNIGLNAIAQYTFTKKNPLPQGLGTGQLYTNNIPSPLTIREGKLFLDEDKKWNMDALNQ